MARSDETCRMYVFVRDLETLAVKWPGSQLGCSVTEKEKRLRRNRVTLSCAIPDPQMSSFRKTSQNVGHNIFGSC